MKSLRRLLAPALLMIASLWGGEARAQSGCQYIVQGAVLTAAQWQFCFQSKQDLSNPGPVTTTIRRVLVNSTTFFVRSDGTDSALCGLANTAAAACLTGQGAVNSLGNNYDLGTNLQTIYFVNTGGGGGTTYSGNINIPQWTGNGNVAMDGDNNVTINGTITLGSVIGSSPLILNAPSAIILKNLILTSPAVCINATNSSVVIIAGTLTFGNCTTQAIGLARSAVLQIASGYTITAGGTAHYVVAQNATINTVGFGSVVVTLTGSPTFSTAFALFSNNASGRFTGNLTYSGAATGVRCNVIQGAVVDQSGLGANYFPGNSACTTSTGGQVFQ